MQIPQNLLQNEIYVIPSGEDTILYAPLTRNYIVCEGEVSEDEARQWGESVSNLDQIPDFVMENVFQPKVNSLKVRMNLTSGCNLSCKYCSVSAGGSQEKNIAKSKLIKTIDFFAELAEKSGVPEVEITFSGGEPTLKIELIGDLIAHADNVGASHSVHFTYKRLSNGVFSPDKIMQVLRRMKSVQVSWDGFGANNPRYNGDAELASLVWRNIGVLIEKEINVTLLTVLSSFNYTSIEELARLVYETYELDVFFSVIEKLGRAQDDKVAMDYDLMSTLYLATWKNYYGLGMDFNLTGTNIHALSIYPCGVASPNYSLGFNGDISACTLTFNDNSDFAKSFQIGNFSSDTVRLDQARISKMKKYNVLELGGECATCFAKWHCRGGCVYACQGKTIAEENPELCNAIRNIVKEKLYYVATSSGE